MMRKVALLSSTVWKQNMTILFLAPLLWPKGGRSWLPSPPLPYKLTPTPPGGRPLLQTVPLPKWTARRGSIPLSTNQWPLRSRCVIAAPLWGTNVKNRRKKRGKKSSLPQFQSMKERVVLFANVFMQHHRNLAKHVSSSSTNRCRQRNMCQNASIHILRLYFSYKLF